MNFRTQGYDAPPAEGYKLALGGVPGNHKRVQWGIWTLMCCFTPSAMQF
jgi:hypothetical protein